MLDQGATTIWEDWSGSMSHIHDTLISVGSWFIQGIGGIRIDEKSPGFRHFLIKPGIVGDLTFAHASYRSPYGKIASNWRLKRGLLHMDVTVPPGSTATVYVPTTNARRRDRGPTARRAVAGSSSRENREGKAVFEVDSGEYAFEHPWHRHRHPLEVQRDEKK